MATYYINADTGNDTTGDGSQGNPWLTLSKANSSSTSGDTIFCQNSTNTYLFQNLSLGGKTIVGESLNGVIFSDQGTPVSTGWTSPLLVDNITFDNITSSGGGSYDRAFGGSYTIQNCIFKNITSTDSWRGGFFNSNVEGAYTATFLGCIIYNFTGGVFCRTGTSTTNVYNCVIDYTNSSGAIFSGQGPGLFRFKNNIIYNDSGGTKGTLSYNLTGPIFDYNCLYGLFSYMPSGTGNLINTDPLFIDAANRNYNLSPSSPCIDAGTLI
jgi:hypothetical protein